jgi:5-methyltetrahydrofolate--homocysteine methyltransferase
MPRQREDKEVCFSLADFIAPLGAAPVGGSSPPGDHLGAFIVTAGIGTDALAARFERDLDDYSAIMAKALADRLAEAFAEYLHHQARVDWGYGKTEALSHDDIVAERYRGIRPAFGYPACPDHSPKGALFALLDHADHHGVSLTESYAMYPTASVSGLYFAHPGATYFSAGRQR